MGESPPSPQGETLDIAEVMQTLNVAMLCGRRAAAIVAAGDLEKYADIMPIYVRLAEAEVKLRRT